MTRGTRRKNLQERRALAVECPEHALAEVRGVGYGSLRDVRLALRQCEQAESGPRVVRPRFPKPEIQFAEHHHLDRQAGIQEPDQLAEALSRKHLVAADQHEGWAEFEFVGFEILPVQVRKGSSFPLDAVRLIDLQPCETQQPRQFRGLVQMAFCEAGGDLRSIAGHVDDHRRLERVVRESACPCCGAAACNREPVAGAAQAMGARDEVVMRRTDALRKIDKAQQVFGVHGMVATCFPDALGEFAQVDPRAARRPESLTHGFEVFDSKRMRERFFDQVRYGFAGIGQRD